MSRKRLEPVPPGEILLDEFMRPLHLSINRLAWDIDVPPNRISAIVLGKRAIMADTALRLGKYFSVLPETWLDLHSDYDLRLCVTQSGPKSNLAIAPSLPDGRHDGSSSPVAMLAA